MCGLAQYLPPCCLILENQAEFVFREIKPRNWLWCSRLDNSNYALGFLFFDDCFLRR